jgi:hypothetical protein
MLPSGYDEAVIEILLLRAGGLSAPERRRDWNTEETLRVLA